RAQTCQRFAQETAATADVQNSQALKRPDGAAVLAEMADEVLADIGKTHGVEFVQGFELALGIPPLFGHGREFCDFGVIYGGLGHEVAPVQARYGMMMRPAQGAGMSRATGEQLIARPLCGISRRNK